MVGQIIELDASNWQSKHDFYEALAQGLRSFAGHGRNADAFLETMVYYLELNEVQPPYEIRISHPSDEMRPFLQEFSGWVAEARKDRVDDPDWGDDVRVSVVVS